MSHSTGATPETSEGSGRRLRRSTVRLAGNLLGRATAILAVLALCLASCSHDSLGDPSTDGTFEFGLTYDTLSGKPAPIEWFARDSHGEPDDPGKNVWSSSPTNVSTDAEGLHLAITREGSNPQSWRCAEVFTEEPFGYGEYVFYMTARPDRIAEIDPRLVLGLFSFVKKAHKNEIDIEFTGSFEGSEDGYRLYFAVQPPEADDGKRYPKLGQDQKGYAIDLGHCGGSDSGKTTCKYTWSPGHVRFEMFCGHSRDPASSSHLIASWTYPPPGLTANQTPEEGSGLRVHINLWLNEKAPVDRTITRIPWTIADFEFHPLPEASGDSATVLAIDVSGSMNDPDATDIDKIVAAKAAAAAIADMLSTENQVGGSHRVGLVSFNDSATAVVPMTSDLVQVRSGIASLTADGNTNLYEALDVANGQLSGTAGEPIVILLSDGLPTRGPGGGPEGMKRAILDGPVRDAALSGHCIYAVGFGDPDAGTDSIDPGFLDAIVRGAGCFDSHYAANEAFALRRIYIEARYDSMGREEIGRADGTILQNQTVALDPMSIPPGSCALYANLAWPGSALDLNLTDPSGERVDDAYPGATIGVFEDMVYTIVEDPSAGDWRVEIHGRDVPTGVTQYAFLAAVEEGAELPAPSPTPPEPPRPELGMLRFEATGEVDLVLRDPQGRIVSKEFDAVDDMTYEESVHRDWITIANRILGDYEVRVVPETDADRLGRYHLSAADGFDTVELADRKFVIHIPEDPYIVRSTLDGFLDVTGSPGAPAPAPEPRGEREPLPVMTWILIGVGTVVLIGGGVGLVLFLRSRHYI